MKKFLFLMLGLFVFILGGCAEYYETSTVEGTIVEMEFDEAHWEKKTKTVDGKTKTTRKWVEDEWEIVVKYKDEEKEFEFETDEVYKKFKVGDKIKLSLETGYSKEHKVVSENFYLPKDLSIGLK